MVWPAVAAAVGGAAVTGAFNAREARKDRDFQEKMSRTQYQRAAADLEAAGLNRVLALGSPAAQPAGAKASMDNPRIAESGIAAASAKQAIAQGKAQEELLKAQTAETLERTRLTAAEAAKAEVTRGMYEELGPTAERAFEAIGSGVRSVTDPDALRRATEGIVTGARNVRDRIIENHPAGLLWRIGKEKFENARDYFRSRNRRRQDND